MTFDPAKTRPMNGWLLCKALEPSKKYGKLWKPETAEDREVTGSGVAEVLAAGPGPLHEESGVRMPMGVEVGELILYRGFLRFAQQVGEQFGERKGSKVFFLHISDVLATVTGPGAVGLHGEYIL